MGLNPNVVVMTIAQITNATTVPGTTPSVSHNGLPFRTYASLSSPMPISGDVIGFGDFTGLVLAYFGLDATTGDWSTGTAWMCDVTTTSTYTGSIPAAADEFTAVVMSFEFWEDFLADNPANGGVVSVTYPPSPGTYGVQEVQLSTTFLPGQGRSLYVAVGTAPAPQDFASSRRWTIPAGEVFPQGIVPLQYAVQQADENTGYTVNGQPVQPTSAAFITALLDGTPYVMLPSDQVMTPHMPTPGSLMVATVQGISLQADVPGGYLCVMLYQSNNNSMYLLVGAAGPGGILFTEGVQIYQGTPLQDAEFELTSLINVFSNRVTFNVVSISEQVDKSALSDLIIAMIKAEILLVKLMFALITD